LLFTLTNVVAQKVFEGIIHYTIHDNEGKSDEEIDALFGKPGIKLNIVRIISTTKRYC